MTWGERPVILLGAGLHRIINDDPSMVLETGLPVLSTWQAADLIDNTHTNYFGRPGIWGTRAANRILYEADQVIVLGARQSVWAVGYDFPRKGQSVESFYPYDAGVPPNTPVYRPRWLAECRGWRALYPTIESPAHDDPERGIHPWRFTDALHKYLRPNEVIVTDMGTALVAAHQVLRLKPPQRLMTSGGLGEMGVALPAAIGASFSRNKGEVLCLHCDGGMMLNLQELQTIVHHRLPIKIIVYRNNSYAMLRQTQDIAGYAHENTTPETGVSFPNFRTLALTFGLAASEVYSWKDFHEVIPKLFESKGPALVEYHFKDVDLLPKLLPGNKGFYDMSPQRG